MANRRMVDKKISISEDVASLTTAAQLLFTWMIPHADDVGLLPYSARQVKALIIPMNDDFTVESIGIHLEAIHKAGLIEGFEWDGDKFWRLKNFGCHQTLKKDRLPQTIAKNLNSWKTVETIWKTLETQGTEGSKETEASKKDWEDFKKKFKIKTF